LRSSGCRCGMSAMVARWRAWAAAPAGPPPLAALRPACSRGGRRGGGGVGRRVFGVGQGQERGSALPPAAAAGSPLPARAPTLRLPSAPCTCVARFSAAASRPARCALPRSPRLSHLCRGGARRGWVGGGWGAWSARAAAGSTRAPERQRRLQRARPHGPGASGARARTASAPPPSHPAPHAAPAPPTCRRPAARRPARASRPAAAGAQPARQPGPPWWPRPAAGPATRGGGARWAGPPISSWSHRAPLPLLPLPCHRRRRPAIRWAARQALWANSPGRTPPAPAAPSCPCDQPATHLLGGRLAQLVHHRQQPLQLQLLV
jgi:hypothetical protein